MDLTFPCIMLVIGMVCKYLVIIGLHSENKKLKAEIEDLKRRR